MISRSSSSMGRNSSPALSVSASGGSSRPCSCSGSGGNGRAATTATPASTPDCRSGGNKRTSSTAATPTRGAISLRKRSVVSINSLLLKSSRCASSRSDGLAARALGRIPVGQLALDVQPENVHEILSVGHYAESLVCSAILELAHHELRRVHADRRQLTHRSVSTAHESGEHVTGSDRVERGRDQHREGGARGMPLHRVLRRQRVGNHLGQWSVVADRPGQDERHLSHDARVHDAVLDDPLLHRLRYRAGRAHLVDRPHVQPVTNGQCFARLTHMLGSASCREVTLYIVCSVLLCLFK